MIIPDSRGKTITKPKVNDKLLYGGIVSYSVSGVIQFRDKYGFRVFVTFENHPEEVILQRGGYNKRSEAEQARQLAVVALHGGKFIPYDFKLKEFYDYWLYYYMIDVKNITYNTYMSYRNCIYNYILPAFEDKKLSQITHNSLVKFLSDITSMSILSSIKGVLFSSFAYAESRNLIAFNHVPSAVLLVLSQKRKEKKQLSLKNTTHAPECKFKVMSAKQAALLLYTCKIHEPEIYMPLLFTITTGLRISEAFAVKYQDIDIRKKELYVQRQLGRNVTVNKTLEGPITAQDLTPKSQRGVRIIPLPDFVIEEIILSRKRYLELKNSSLEFNDNDYIACRGNGNAIPVTTAYTPYKHIYDICKLPYLKWHELRHTYATLLATEKINMKAVSECMGHMHENFTMDVYVEPQHPVYDVTLELNEFSKNIVPQTRSGTEKTYPEMISEDVLLEFLPKASYNTNDTK